MPRFLVSVESLAVPARSAVLKSLQARLGLAVVSDNERCASPFAILLHRLRALARLPAGAHVLWSGCWLLAAPRDPLLRRLHRDLGEALAEKLLPAGAGEATHVLLCLDASADEAFEALLDGEAGGGAGREASLRCLREAQALLDRPDASVSPFAAPRVERLHCPRFAADNPATLAKLLDLACSACSRHLPPPGA